MDKRNVEIKTVRPDGALRSGDFNLLPVNPQAPIITSHPLRNFSQLTWKSPKADGKEELKSVQPINDTYIIRKGTAVSWALYATDPSNVSNINDLSGLTFVWKRDGSPLYNFNRLNQGSGVSVITYTEEQSVEELTGEYVCEVSNEFGTTSTIPFTLRVVDLDNDNLLYKNLIQNGDGEGGDSGWTNTSGKVVSKFTEKSTEQNTQNTLSLHNFFPITTGSEYTKALPFRFTYTNSYNQFYNSYRQWNLIEPNLNNTEIPTNQITPLPQQYRWISTRVRSNTIPNEDINDGDTAQSFFPGPNYLDKYNKNNIASRLYGAIPLKDEMDVKGRALTYFTRDRISFQEEESVDIKQTVDVSEVANLIDGQVGGVDYVTAQLFAYVGSALSRMKIRCTINGETVEYPWLVHDLTTYRRWLTEAGSATRDSNNAIVPDLGTAIEIVPIADDSVELDLSFIGESDNVLNTQNIKGPDAVDLWAIKEKVDFPLTLFPLFAFFKPNRNPIKVFNQTYTNTDALDGLFYHKSSKVNQSLDEGSLQQLINKLTDRNAKFIAQRWGEYYNEYNRLAYNDLWVKDGEFYQQLIPVTLQKMTVTDKGSAAFFGIGKTVNIPKQTRSVEIKIKFNNSSPARLDSNPRGKGWNSSEIYNTLFQLQPTLSPNKAPNPLYEYGDPRCGVTKVKLQLIPNNDTTSEKHTTYTLPPARNTVAGIARNRVFQNVHNTAEPGPFQYTLIQPEPLQQNPTPARDLSGLINIANQSIIARSEGYADINSLVPVQDTIPTTTELRSFEINTSINREGEDFVDIELGSND